MWHPNGKYKISYELNGGSGGPSAPQTGTQIGGEITLDSTRPTNSNSNLYFTGWCNKQTLDNMCSGKVYWPGEAYPLSDGYSVTMYALWAPLELRNLGNLNTTMQEFNCNEKLPNVHNYGTVTDSRDNNTYSVARLKDGRCWMTQNLRIQNYSLTPENSDVDEVFKLSSSSSDWACSGYNCSVSPAKEKGVYCNSSDGCYYSWYISTSGEPLSFAQLNIDAPHSICPRGWGLPSKIDVDYFISFYDGTSVFQNPVNFTRSGQFESYSVYYGGWSPWLWTSTGNSKNDSRNLVYMWGVWNNDLQETYNGDRGGSVRCLKK